MRGIVKYTLAPLGGLAVVLALASPASAHVCTNPMKNEKAPHAGVNYRLTGFDGDGPVLEQIGPGKGLGGFAEVAPGVLGNETTAYTYTHGVVGGATIDSERACDGKGIDYLFCP